MDVTSVLDNGMWNPSGAFLTLVLGKHMNLHFIYTRTIFGFGPSSKNILFVYGFYIVALTQLCGF